jgi:sarcosine oxidase
VKRQHVGYFAWPGEPEDARPGRFPVWVYLGAPEDGVWYGLPEFGRPGIKAAFHATGGGGDDPDDRHAPDPRELERVRAFLAHHLATPPGALLHAETCLYTNTADEQFVVGALPGHPRVIVGSACSGHGFKFGPLMGRILAGLAIDGRTGVPEFGEPGLGL